MVGCYSWFIALVVSFNVGWLITQGDGWLMMLVFLRSDKA
jgi:hypothetical protein